MTKAKAFRPMQTWDALVNAERSVAATASADSIELNDGKPIRPGMHGAPPHNRDETLLSADEYAASAANATAAGQCVRPVTFQSFSNLIGRFL